MKKGMKKQTQVEIVEKMLEAARQTKEEDGYIAVSIHTLCSVAGTNAQTIHRILRLVEAVNAGHYACSDHSAFMFYDETMDLGREEDEEDVDEGGEE